MSRGLLPPHPHERGLPPHPAGSPRDGSITGEGGGGGTVRSSYDPPKKYARKTVRFYHLKIRAHISTHLPKYAQIEPHIIPIRAPYRPITGHCFHEQPKTHPAPEIALKTLL